MKYDDIKECEASHFFPGMQELSGYFAAKKQPPAITNVPRLFNLIKVFFELLLYYERHSTTKYLVTVDGRRYEAKIGGRNAAGEACSFDLADIAEPFLKSVFCDLATVITLPVFSQLIRLTNALLVSPSVLLSHKLLILHGELSLTQNSWWWMTTQQPEEVALDSVHIRKEVLRYTFEHFESSIPPAQHDSYNIPALHAAYELYVRTLVRVHIYNNHYDEVIPSLRDELTAIAGLPHVDDIVSRRLLAFLVKQLVLNNNLLQIVRKDYLREIVGEYTDQFDTETMNEINEWLNFSPDDFDLSRFHVARIESEFPTGKWDQIRTVLSFVLPFTMEDASLRLALPDGTKVQFRQITSLLQDPVYTFLDSSDGHINGMPTAFMADSLGNVGRCTSITIEFQEFYHPDFEVVDGSLVPVDLSEEASKRGGVYCPHKDRMLEILWRLYDQNQLPFALERSAIDSNVISNYLVSYIGGTGELLHHRVFTITSFQSYFELKNRFVAKLNSQYVGSDAPVIRDFLLDTRISSRQSLLDFCHGLIERSFQKAVEVGGLDKTLWHDGRDEPRDETHAQRILYSQIRFLAELKGIMLSREVAAAGGELDFHFSYTKNGVLMTVCVEVKNAHSNKLEHGITVQLPLYMRDVGSKEGIFLVLWYKGEGFVEPEGFESIGQLREFLANECPGNCNIKLLVVDCSKKASPSKSGAAKRLSGE